MTPLSTVELLRQIPLIAPLSERELQLLAGKVSKRRLKRSQRIVEKGSTSDAIYILIKGSARVIGQDESGGEVIMARLGPGDCVGEIGILDGEPHSASVVTESCCELLRLGAEHLFAVMPPPSSVQFRLLVGLAQRLRKAQQKIEGLALLGVRQRVYTALLEAAHVDASSGDITTDQLSRVDLAKTIGASRETVTKTMRELEQAGALERLERGRVRLHPSTLIDVKSRGPAANDSAQTWRQGTPHRHLPLSLATAGAPLSGQ